MRHILGILGFAVTIGGVLLAHQVGAADVPASSAKVLILPFSAINQNEYQPWLGRSIQQSVESDLLAAAPGRVISSEAPAADDAAALDAARKVGAQYVIRGEFASVGGDVRVTGQVLDVTSGKAVTAIKATGPSSNVFAMEDDLAAQIRRRLSLTPPLTEGLTAPEPTTPPMQALQTPPQPPVDPYAQTYVAPSQQNSPPPQIQYNYYYSDPTPEYVPDPGWGWLWPSYGFVYVLPSDYHHYHHNWSHFSTASNNRWNGSLAYGTANSVNGTPIGTGVNTLHGSGGTYSIAGGGPRGSAAKPVHSSGTAVHSTSTHIAPARMPTFHMSTGFGFHAGTTMHR